MGRANFEMANALIKAGRCQDAWSILSELSGPATDDPNLTERVSHAKGVCASMLGQAAQARDVHDAAISWYRTAAELLPEVPGHRLAWAWALIKAGRCQDAWWILSDPSRPATDDPDLTERVRHAKGVCASMLGQAAQARDAHDAAISWYRTAAELLPEVPGHRLAWAWALIKAGRCQDAWWILSDLPGPATDDPDLRERVRRAKGACARMLGEAAQARDAHDAAISWYRTAAELLPEVAGHRLAWARALIKADRRQDAWSILSNLSGPATDDPDLTERVRHAKGVCASMLGQAAQARDAHDAAISWYRTAAELLPEVPGHRLAWAWALIKAGRCQDAWSVLSDLSGPATEDPDLTEHVRHAKGACAEALAAERELSVEGTNWIEASRWRLEGIRHAPDRMINWERYAFDLIYAGHSTEARALIANAPSPDIAAVFAETIGDMPRHLQAQVENGTFIYGTVAPRYLARGLPVVPALGKVVIPRNWQVWSDRLPEESVYRHWLEIPWANIGLVLGPKSGVCAIDIDTDDPELIELVRSTLPHSPWCRVGRRGMALAYRWTGLPSMCCIESRTPSLFELYLCARGQILIPPSLHPLTGQPYRANRDLLDVLDDLPALSSNFAEMLTQELKAKGCAVRLYRTA
jgi:predicted Zn-dependent protease